MSQFHFKFILNSLNDEANLPQALPTLVPSLLNSSNSGHDEASITKLHTRLSSLLQSKDVELRWCGICLVKAVLTRSKGRWESLMSHGLTWTKLLLRILEREVDEAVIERAVATVGHIVHMTEGKPSLTRELTTPSLPTFFNHIFSILSRESISDSLKKALLYHTQVALRSHSTTFRPFAGKLQALTLGVINGSSSDADLLELAAQCFASLHMCAPKNTSSEQWTTGFNAVIGECHACLSYLFQAVVENAFVLPIPAGLSLLSFTSEYTAQVPLVLRRLNGLLQTLIAFLCRSTKTIVKIPVGQLIMLLHRILEITPRSGIRASTPQTSQVALISILPRIHEMTFDFASILVKILGNHLAQHIQPLQEIAIEDCQSQAIQCKCAALRFLSLTVDIFGLTVTDSTTFTKLTSGAIRTISNLIPSATSVDSAIATSGSKHPQQVKKRKHGNANDGSDMISHDAAFHDRPSTTLLTATVQYLSAILQHTSGLITRGTRHQIDHVVLRILSVPGYDFDPKIIVLLLQLLGHSILAPEPSSLAASVLSAGVQTVSTLCSHKNVLVQQAAIQVGSQLEVLIHPRFPPFNKRTQQEAIEEAQDMYDDGTGDHAGNIADEQEESDGGGEEEEEEIHLVSDDKGQHETQDSPKASMDSLFKLPPKSQTIPTDQSVEQNAPTIQSSHDHAVDAAAESEEPESKKARRDSDDRASPIESSSLTEGQEPGGVAKVEAESEPDESHLTDDEMPEICMDSDTDVEE